MSNYFKFLLTGPNDVCVCLYSRVLIIVWDREAGAGTDSVWYRHTQYCCQSTSVPKTRGRTM